MTHKRIIYGTHVCERMLERQIGRSDVKWLLAEGVRQVEGARGDTTYWSRRGYLGKREAKVVYIETAAEIILVTVVWIWTGRAGSK
jgi:hypothetical protein